MKGTWETTDTGLGGLGLAAAVIAAAVVAVPVIDAVAAVAEVFVIAVAVLAALAIAGGAALVVYRIRRGPAPAPPWRANYNRAAPLRPAARPSAGLPAPQRPAIEQPAVHFHFHGVTAEEIAEALRRRESPPAPAGNTGRPS
jgi:hypothetical protein